MLETHSRRQNMINGQLLPNQVFHPGLIQAFQSIPRENFLGDAQSPLAYADEDIVLPSGGLMMKPMVLGRLVQALEITSDEKVLDVGCATGYSSALLSYLADQVIGLERDGPQAAQASHILSEGDFSNVDIVQGTLSEGYPQQAPYDVILIHGSLESVPEKLFDQLADGGRLGCVISTHPAVGTAMLYLKRARHVSARPLFDAFVPGLSDFQKEKPFIL